VSAAVRIPAMLMRGGTSKGLFLRLDDLPEAARAPGAARDRLLQRLCGSPDPYGTQIDGLGGATSSTSKVVILSRGTRAAHDVDYLFGQVMIDRPGVDWSGNCGNLTAAAAAFALHAGLVDAARVPHDGVCTVRLWQANIGRSILAEVPVRGGQVQEHGAFLLDGVAFAAAGIALTFLDPGDGEGALLPTGAPQDRLDVPGLGTLAASLVNAGIATVFVRAQDLGCTGTETRAAVNADPALLARLEAVRVAGALRMGLIATAAEGAARAHTPKLVMVAPPAGYTASDGRAVRAADIDLLARAVSMGQLHHAMMGTASVAIAAAAAVRGTLVHEAAGGIAHELLRVGHPAGTLRVGAQAACVDGRWQVTRATMTRSARVLMDGHVRLPPDTL
jgi:probable AcnD-accessory protein PrpF